MDFVPFDRMTARQVHSVDGPGLLVRPQFSLDVDEAKTVDLPLGAFGPMRIGYCPSQHLKPAA